MFHKEEYKKCFAYTAQTAYDKNGYIMNTTINPRNVHNSTAFDELYNRLKARYPEIETIVTDAG